MKKILLSFVILLCANITLAQPLIENLPDIQYRNPDGTNFTNDFSYPKITQIENSIFQRSYENEPIEIRLKRLEEKFLGKETPNISLSQRVENIENIIDEKSVNEQSLKTLCELEKKFFKKEYKDENPRIRTQRLERMLLGANQQGDLNSRIQTVKIASNSTNGSYYQPNNYGYENPNIQTPYSNYYQSAQNNQVGFKNTIKNLFNVFSGGAMTGYTPSINQGYNYPSLYSRVPNNYSQPYWAGQNPYNYSQVSYPNNYQRFYGEDNGDEMYYSDGQYYKNFKSTDGGCGVTIIK